MPLLESSIPPPSERIASALQCAWSPGGLDKAAALAQAAVDEADDATRDAAQAAHVLVRWSGAAAAGRVADGLAEAVVAVGALREAGYADALSGVYHRLGLCLGLIGDFEAGLQWLEVGIADARAREDLPRRLLSMSHLGQLLTYSGEYDRAMQAFNEMQALAEGQPGPYRAMALNNLASCQLLAAQSAEHRAAQADEPESRPAWEGDTQAAGLDAAPGEVAAAPPEGDGRVGVDDALLLAGQALALAREALAATESLPGVDERVLQQGRASVLDTQGRALTVLGRFDEAADAFSRSLAIEGASARTHASASLGMADLHLRQHRFDDATAWLDRAEALQTDDLTDFERDRAIALRIELARQRGRLEALHALWERRHAMSRRRYADRLRHVRRHAELLAEFRQVRRAERQAREQADTLRRNEAALRAAKESLEKANRQLRAANRELDRLAHTDALTAVSSRHHFESVANRLIADARRQEHPLSMLLLDLDHFKTINDDHGHLVGDRVLAEVARRLSHRLRAGDVLARWGGEEFAVLLPSCRRDDAVAVAEWLRELVAVTPFETVGRVTASFGVSERRPDESLEAWLQRTDRALYQAKAGGRNGVVVAA